MNGREWKLLSGKRAMGVQGEGAGLVEAPVPPAQR
jgi:hypothetical protein